MKKAEAISILATSIRPREAKDRARYDEAVKMAIEALKCSETPKSSERTTKTTQTDHVAESGRKVEQTDESAQNVQNGDLIQRKAAIEALARMMPHSYTPDGSHPADEEIFRVQEVFADCIEALEILPSAQPDRKLIDDYMWKIKQNISPHTAAEGVIAIKYYLEQIYEQIYGKGEKPKWMT